MFRNHDVRYVLLLLGLSLLTWIPRLRGPIDLRYDAGVTPSKVVNLLITYCRFGG